MPATRATLVVATAPLSSVSPVTFGLSAAVMVYVVPSVRRFELISNITGSFEQTSAPDTSARTGIGQILTSISIGQPVVPQVPLSTLTVIVAVISVPVSFGRAVPVISAAAWSAAVPIELSRTPTVTPPAQVTVAPSGSVPT